jgi:hypothetical protein
MTSAALYTDAFKMCVQSEPFVGGTALKPGDAVKAR